MNLYDPKITVPSIVNYFNCERNRAVITVSNDDLPAPDGPIIAKKSPD